MINSVSKLISDPNNFGPNFIADMAEYSKKAMALFREFDSGKKQKGSNATKSSETKKKENESTDASKKPSTSEKQSKTVEKDTKDEQQIPEDRVRRLEEVLGETFKLTKPLDDRKYWKFFPESYDEYKKIYDAIIKYYEDMRGKLNTNDILEDNDENSRLSNLIKIIKKSDKIKQIKNLHDTSEYNMIRALQNASSELQIYKQSAIQITNAREASEKI